MWRSFVDFILSTYGIYILSFIIVITTTLLSFILNTEILYLIYIISHMIQKIPIIILLLIILLKKYFRKKGILFPKIDDSSEQSNSSKLLLTVFCYVYFIVQFPLNFWSEIFSKCM